MGLGYALTEDYPLENSRPLAKYGTLGLLRANEVPPIDVVLVKTKDNGEYAYGAKGVGEDPIIAIGPAIVNAIYDAIGVRFHHYPIRPEQVLQALHEKALAAIPQPQGAYA